VAVISYQVEKGQGRLESVSLQVHPLVFPTIMVVVFFSIQ